jgi:hypothetical protein
MGEMKMAKLVSTGEYIEHKSAARCRPRRRVATGLERHRLLTAGPGVHFLSASAFGGPEPGLTQARNAPPAPGPLYRGPAPQ